MNRYDSSSGLDETGQDILLMSKQGLYRYNIGYNALNEIHLLGFKYPE